MFIERRNFGLWQAFQLKLDRLDIEPRKPTLELNLRANHSTRGANEN
jgi:hypothetical protein